MSGKITGQSIPIDQCITCFTISNRTYGNGAYETRRGIIKDIS